MLREESPACRFIFAFGAAGILVLITASTALVGVAHNSAFCLGLYSFLMVVLLLAQAALAIAFFADKSWKKKLPHDETAEAVSHGSRKGTSKRFSSAQLLPEPSFHLAIAMALD